MLRARESHVRNGARDASVAVAESGRSYYDILERTQKGTMDVTPWMDWFLGCLGRAIDGAQETLNGVLAKARFCDRVKDVKLNERQRLVINRLLDGFEGKLTTSKYATLAKCSQDTAHRDILKLIDRGVMVQNPEGGRSTSYSLTRGSSTQRGCSMHKKSTELGEDHRARFSQKRHPKAVLDHRLRSGRTLLD